MARKTNIAKIAAAAAKLAAEQEAAALAAAALAAEQAEAEEAEQEEDAPRVARSVVAAAYKARYRAREGSSKGRNCADWLAQTLPALVLVAPGGKLCTDALVAICEANAADPSYPNRTPGWEGRMRMTLGLRLRPIVAAQGFLLLADGQQLAAPSEFVAAYRK